MARARNIKPKFFINDDLGELSPLARLLFIGMWTIADFNGCLEFKPKRIKTQILPYDTCDIEELSNNLDKSGFIAIYSVQGKRYIKILKFKEHQNPHKNEREAGTDIPDITEKDNGIMELSKDGINRDKNGTAPAESLFLNPSSLNPLPESLSCAEPQSDSTPVAIKIPLVDKTEFSITKQHVEEWESAYPAVDVLQQLREMRQWCIANPTKKKTSRGVMAFCNSWLAKEQDRPQQARASPKQEKFNPTAYVNRPRNNQNERTIITDTTGEPV